MVKRKDTSGERVPEETGRIRNKVEGVPVMALFFLISQDKGLSILLMFSKNQLLVSFIFSMLFFISISFISALISILQSDSHQNHMVLAQRQTYRSVEQDRKPRIQPTHLQPTIYDKGGKSIYTMEKRQPLQ